MAHLLPSPREAVPGAVAGSVSVLLGHPLDTLKTRLQARAAANGASKPSTAFGSPTLQEAAALFRSCGVRGFYRGVAPPLLLNGTKRSFQFALWERLVPACGGSTGAAGALAGLAGTVVSCPFHVVKILSQNTTPATATAGPTNSAEWALHVWRTDGPRGFYRGIFVHGVRDAGFAGVYLGTYGALRRHAAESAAQSGPVSGPWRMLQVGGAAAAASTLTWVVMFPLDTIKTALQAGAPVAVDARALWRGLGPAMIRAGPVSALSMNTYEALRAAMAPPADDSP